MVLINSDSPPELYKNDLPSDFPCDTISTIAIDTETLGLNPLRDRLCVLQFCLSDNKSYLVQFDGQDYNCPVLNSMLSNNNILKIFHFARFDLAVISHYLKIDCKNIFCTKIASKLIRTYTHSHGLKDLTREYLGVTLCKECQSSDWSSSILSTEQIRYAVNDVIYLHKLYEILHKKLVESNRLELANSCFDFLPTRAKLDIMGWLNNDILQH